MRIPRFTELTTEQKKLYLEVPLHGTTLVSGPPGTGKTVIALLRGAEATRAGKTVVVGMYNQTLRAYVGASEAEFDLPNVDTVNRIFRRTWYAVRPPPRQQEETVVLSTPYAEKDEAKRLGATFTNKLFIPKTTGVWVVDGEKYRANPGGFARWKPYRTLPALAEDHRQIDWEQLASGLLSCDDDASNPISWDHLVIDEGQDFPPSFYRALHRLMTLYGADLPSQRKPALTVLADENQRLTYGSNSTIADIERELRVPAERHFRLEQNFRNTRQIAKCAAHFYCGAPSGVPGLPADSGPVPELHRFSSRDAACTLIKNYAMANRNHRIGVLVGDDNRSRQAYFDGLVSVMPGRSICTYEASSGKKGADEISFDEAGAILVLNRSSCKGLEFDAVFVVDLQAARVEEAAAEFFKMGMYVMCSRARRALFLTWIGTADEQPSFLDVLPDAPLLVRKGC